MLGNYGVVYKARCKISNRIVAVKEISLKKDAKKKITDCQ